MDCHAREYCDERLFLKAPEETKKAFKDGWFWTGDIAVMHKDGYIEIKDRSKDIIISGGENISSIEIEKIYLIIRQS